MEIRTFKYTATLGRRKVYYPHILCVWTARYRSIFGEREEKIATMTNLIKGGTGFTSIPSTEKMKAVSTELIPASMSTKEAENEAQEMLYRYYLHKARSWKVPEFHHHSTEKIYVPYECFSKRSRWSNKELMYLYEPISHCEDLLKKYPEIKAFVELEEVAS